MKVPLVSTVFAAQPKYNIKFLGSFAGIILVGLVVFAAMVAVSLILFPSKGLLD